MVKKEKILWIELLRITSCLGVIMLHMGSQHFRDISVDSFSWIASNFYHGITRFAVACFVMISGSLYLNENRKWTPEKAIKSFLPIGASFVFWQFFYAVFRILKSDEIVTTGVDFIKKVCIMMSESYFHLWYLPMLLGLVLVAPLIWKIVNGENGKQWAEFLLVLFFLFQIIPNTVNDFSYPYKEYILSIINLVKPNLITGYVGYFVLGHYLTKYEIHRKIEIIIYALGIIFIGCSIYLCQYSSFQNGKATQVYYENFTVSALFMSVGVFLFFKNRISKIRFNEKSKNIIITLGSFTFGIYLVHPFIRDLLQIIGIDSLSFNTFVAIPVITVIIFSICSVVVAVVKKIPVISKWIM